LEVNPDVIAAYDDRANDFARRATELNPEEPVVVTVADDADGDKLCQLAAENKAAVRYSV